MLTLSGGGRPGGNLSAGTSTVVPFTSAYILPPLYTTCTAVVPCIAGRINNTSTASRTGAQKSGFLNIVDALDAIKNRVVGRRAAISPHYKRGKKREAGLLPPPPILAICCPAYGIVPRLTTPCPLVSTTYTLLSLPTTR